ncbi:hypothetical protein SLG_25420 [Sphingobium sp. SYK-6]|uniref:hypothetical protein n=1 Tax=Sphingobium sp. (strain NBRC 103272 / SYK-6) TaxID=627192 RepID=UPI0002277613|nr:hypothetical protein [Sphingobium sp. SYK-6]BAK67217.1 hypothetical protein SLG_25420 [Sphingobium sp. SYK-6]
MTLACRGNLAGLAAALACAMSATPLQAQMGGLLGDSDVTAGQGGSATPSAAREGRGDRKSRKSRRDIAISPYLEVDQTAIWNLKGGDGDTVTYTSVAAGVTASIETANAALGADVRYEHQFAWGGGRTDQDILSGIVNGRIDAVRNVLSIEAGALATRVRADGYIGANTTLADVTNTAHTYSAYIGPNLSVPVGDLTVTGAYRLGYNRVDTDFGAAAAVGAPVAGYFDESWLHVANAAVGMQPGVLPVGWSLGVGWIREDASQLDQRFDDKYARADITVPISPTVALVGGVGYEKIEISNRDALRDANGVPVRDENGRFVTDSASPRRLSYDQDGIIWDAGVLWRPNPRLEAELRVGHRYGSMSYTGSLAWRGRNTAVNVVLFDSVDSFGRALNGALANIGTDFYVVRNPFSGDLTGCAFGDAQAGGACFTDTLTGITSANFRNRGVVAQIARRADAWTVSAAAGYAHRKFISDGQSVLAPANGLADQNYFAMLGASRAYGSDAAFDVMGYVNYFDSGTPGIGDVTNIGANVGYRRMIWRRLSASAAIGIDSIDTQAQQSFISLLAQIGLRYQF